MIVSNVAVLFLSISEIFSCMPTPNINMLSEQAQYLMALVEAAPYRRSRFDLIKDLRIAYFPKLGFKDATDIFDDLLDKNLIRAQAETVADGVVHRAGTYGIV